MTQTLVTGGTGLIGSHLVRALARRGDDLRLLIRRKSSAEHLEGIEFERINGEITDRRAVRRAVEGCDRVFHVAGSTSLRHGDDKRVFAVNVDGTRLICEAALEAGVGRLIHTSSVAAIGPAEPGGRADESQLFTAGELGIAYVNSKHEAEGEVLRAAAHGLDAVIVNPTFTLGPGGPEGTSMLLIKRFLLRRLTVYVDGGLNIVDVRDIAEGHLLAEKKGRTAERYILGGRNFTLQRLFADLSRISGVPAPEVRVPANLAVGASRMMERVGLPLGASSEETRSAGLWWTYSSAKAKRELGFKARPHEETLTDAVRWQAEQLGERVGADPGAPVAALGLAARAIRAAGRLSPR